MDKSNAPLERLGQLRLKSNSYTVSTSGGEATFVLRPILLTPGHVQRLVDCHFGTGTRMRQVRTGKFNVYKARII